MYFLVNIPLRYHQVEELFSMGVPVDSTDEHGNTCLHVSCQNGIEIMFLWFFPNSSILNWSISPSRANKFSYSSLVNLKIILITQISQKLKFPERHVTLCYNFCFGLKNYIFRQINSCILHPSELYILLF